MLPTEYEEVDLSEGNSGRPRRFGRRHWACVIGVVIVLGGWWLRHEYDEGQESSRCHVCKLNLDAIRRAVAAYKDAHGTLPPAYLENADGVAITSWRRLIIEYLSYDANRLRSDISTPWNGSGNLKFLKSSAPSHLQCPVHRAESSHSSLTNYVVVVGENTMWPGARPAVPADDGSDNDKILVIEIVNSDIHWLEPRDLMLEEAIESFNRDGKSVRVGSPHRCGINYLTVGGEVRTLSRDIDRESLRRMLVRD